MELSMAMTTHRHIYQCQKTTRPLSLAQEFALISRRMNTRSTIGGYVHDASIATIRGISTSSAASPTNSVISRDGRNALSPHNIAFTSPLNTQSVPTMECTVSGCGNRNSGWLVSENEEGTDLGGLKYA